MLKSIVIMLQSSARQLARQELFIAQRRLVRHGCQAEYHNAMAGMYADRVRRLRDVVGSAEVDARITESQLQEVAP